MPDTDGEEEEQPKERPKEDQPQETPKEEGPTKGPRLPGVPPEEEEEFARTPAPPSRRQTIRIRGAPPPRRPAGCPRRQGRRHPFQGAYFERRLGQSRTSPGSSPTLAAPQDRQGQRHVKHRTLSQSELALTPAMEQKMTNW